MGAGSMKSSAVSRRACLAAGAPLIARAEAEALVERAVKMSKADEVQINVNTTYTANTRFAANQMSTSGAATDAQVVVQSSFGPQSALLWHCLPVPIAAPASTSHAPAFA